MSEPKVLIWKVSAAWLGKSHDCTLPGILARCHGGCCTSPPGRNYWPAMASGRADHACHYLGAQGCTLPLIDKPITCLLYPVRVNTKRTMILHYRTTVSTSVCAGNHGQGPPLIVAMEDSLVAVFGRDQYDRVQRDVLAGADSYFVVTTAVRQAIADEETWEQKNVVPLPRSRLRHA